MSKIISGVPHGSVIGPILFIIFIHDLEDVLSNKVTFKLFADDLKLYSSFNIPSSYVNLQHALDLLVLWSTSWQLPINQSKTQLLHLGPSQNVHSYHIDGNNIMSTDKVLDLGVTTDSDLSYASHISSIVSKTRSRSCIIFSSFHSHNMSPKASLYIFCPANTGICFAGLEPIHFKVHYRYGKRSKKFYISYSINYTLVLP